MLRRIKEEKRAKELEEFNQKLDGASSQQAKNLAEEFRQMD